MTAEVSEDLPSAGPGEPDGRAVPDGAGVPDGVGGGEPAVEGGLARRVGRGALWSGASTLLLKFANITVMAVVARLMVPEDFGVFAVAITVHAIVSSIGELGVSSCLMRGDLDPDEIAPTIATISIGSSVVLAVSMFAFAQPLASALGSAQAADPMRVMSLAVLLVGVFAVPCAQLVRDFRQGRQFFANVAGFIPGNLLLIGMAYTGGGAVAFAWSRVVAQVVTGLVITFSVSVRYRPGFARHTLGHLLRFGLPLAGANLVNYTLLNADYALVGRLLGAVDLGIYMLAFNISSWSTGLLSAMINGVAMPAFSRVKHDAELLRSSLAGSTRAVAAIALPIAALSLALARPLIETIYGHQWVAAAPVLAVLSLYGAISILCLLFANLLVGLSDTKLLLLVQVFWLAALVPAMAIGVRQGGILGAGIAHIVIVSVLVLPIYLRALRKAAGVRVGSLVRAVLPPLAASAAAGALAYLAAGASDVPAVSLLAGAAGGGLAYAVLISPVARPHLPHTVLTVPLVGGTVDRYDRLMATIAVRIPTRRPEPEES